MKNFARGGGTYHEHRYEIVRDLIDRIHVGEPPLGEYLRNKLFALRQGWTLFQFGPKDWPLCDRLLVSRDLELEKALLTAVIDYAASNVKSITNLYELNQTVSNRLLSNQPAKPDPDSDVLSAIDSQSLFGVRVQCASNQTSTNAMIRALEKTLTHGWARARLINPLVYHASANPPATTLDSFLSYLVTGKEHEAEKIALKLMLSDEAARETSLSFKIYIGLLGHPYDAIEFVLDHIEYIIARGGPVPEHVAKALDALTFLAPLSRATDISSTLEGTIPFIDEPNIERLVQRFQIPQSDLNSYAGFFRLDKENGEIVDKAQRPYDILANMRATPYPDPSEFQIITALHALWHFTDAGRLIGAMLRSIYMIDRASRDLEARDVLRLTYMTGFTNPFIVSAPSAMFLFRSLATRDSAFNITPAEMERLAGDAFEQTGPTEDRLWINQLQWSLRGLEEDGQVEAWLSTVRSQTKLRPSFLTGINWHWVEEIIDAMRLRPFRSFDGAYLFVHMELETSADPQRLRLTLEPLIRNMPFDQAVSTIIQEFGVASQAIVRRFFTTANLLASGMAGNYVAALDQRVRALEECILTFDFGPLLTEEIYESEVKTLTAELLLTDVNAGKFEVPWDTFHKDAAEMHEDLFHAVSSLRSRFDEAGPLTAKVEIPVSFPNGRTHKFKIRNLDQPVFALIMTLISGYMQHPAFGLEVILSGRFRHNNLMQELWAAMSDVGAARIPSVTPATQTRLVEDYRVLSEQIVDEWCLKRLQTKRPAKPDGLFDLIPTTENSEALVNAAAAVTTLAEIIDIVTKWIKDVLRKQVASACDVFENELSCLFSNQFEDVKLRQLSENTYRDQDVLLVHTAVSNAVLRRLRDLRHWFDGVDSVNNKPISFANLSAVTEALFENMIPGRRLNITLDDSAASITYQPNQVKIAFDLLREIYFNALSKGKGPTVDLIVTTLDTLSNTYVFHNAAEPCELSQIGEQIITGERYAGRNDAVKREGNSGRAKIAASSATIIGCDTSITCKRTISSYELVVRMAKAEEIQS